MWGCRPHWYKSPKTLRAKVWATYVPGQEVNKNPSAEYVEVGRTSRHTSGSLAVNVTRSVRATSV